MRKVVAGLFVSLDGVVEAPNEWQFDVFNDEMVDQMTAFLADVDTVLLGRVTYQEWQPYWPNSTDEPYASFINTTPKYVFSTTLDRVDWKNAHLVKVSLADEVNRLKQQPGKRISVAGSPTLVRSLIQQNLLDELTLMIHPVVVGHGKRLFNEGSDLKRLNLVSCQSTKTGVVFLTYQPARGS